MRPASVYPASPGLTGRSDIDATDLAEAPTTAPAPGKRTLVERAYGAGLSAQDRHLLAELAASLRDAGATVQAREGVAPAADPAQVHAAARAGVAGGGGRLPFAELIQAAFGHHRVDHVSAHVGGAAAAACEAIGATAYATGDAIAFGSGPDLHTAAHEAAHVVQQRAGLRLDGGVGRRGDVHEDHADRVADAVVAGRSAEHLLDQVAAPSAAPAPAAAVQRQDRACTPGTPVARGDLSAMRTAALGYCGDYFSAAQAGILAFEGDLDTSFDWTAFWVAVGGNLLWATASFATGGAAFVISVAGIAVSTAAAASTVRTGPDFRAAALVQLNGVVTHLNNQVDRVTRAVDAEAQAGGWDDSRTRAEILHRLFRRDRPEFVLDACGHLPNVNQPAIAASVREQLLIQASQQRNPGAVWRAFNAAYFEEVYTVDAIEYSDAGGMGVFPILRPPQDWSYGRTSARLVGGPPSLTDLNQSMNRVYDAYGSGSRIDPSTWPIEKRLHLTGQAPFDITYVLAADNSLSRIEARSFAAFLTARGYDTDRYLRSLLTMIQGHAGHAMPLVPRLTR
ncbi:MAG: DUF4157 domain-containing protein [Kofleriaceae bacterium]